MHSSCKGEYVGAAPTGGSKWRSCCKRSIRLCESRRAGASPVGLPIFPAHKAKPSNHRSAIRRASHCVRLAHDLRRGEWPRACRGAVELQSRVASIAVMQPRKLSGQSTGRKRGDSNHFSEAEPDKRAGTVLKTERSTPWDGEHDLRLPPIFQSYIRSQRLSLALMITLLP
jgi:hypothetical protein